MKQRICTYEDRPGNFVGIQLLALSLAQHCPDCVLEVTSPVLTEDFRAWAGYQSNVVIGADIDPSVRGYDIKPTLLLRALDRGDRQVIWIDADVLVTADFRELYDEVDETTLVVSQEFFWGAPAGDAYRCRAWKLPVGRTLPFSVNSGFIRVTPHHRGLLADWSALMKNEQYRQAQNTPWRKRPVHFLSDQEVLMALLESSSHTGIDVYYLLRGCDIIMTSGSAGYTLGERVRNSFIYGRKLPPLIHALGPKPWQQAHYVGGPFRNPIRYMEQVHTQVSPYTHAAREYARELDAMYRRNWLTKRSLPARLMYGIGGNNPHLAGLGLCLMDSVGRTIKHCLRRYPWQHRRLRESQPLESSAQESGPMEHKSLGGLAVSAAEHKPIQDRLPAWLYWQLKLLKQWLKPCEFTQRYNPMHRALGRPRQVLAGPFQGMNYGKLADAGVGLCKLLGTVECELHEAVEKIIAAEPDVIINIGAAEGYYAVGLSLRLPQAKAVAYDTSSWARWQLKQMIRWNQIKDRVQVKGWCSPEELEKQLQSAQRPLIFCDCEGYETQLLNPAMVPSLHKAMVLVEVHDVLEPGIGALIESRCQNSHQMNRIDSRARTPADVPSALQMSADDALWAMQENRPGPMYWFQMMPRDNVATKIPASGPMGLRQAA